VKAIIKSIIITGLFCSSSFAPGMEKEKTIVEKHKEFLAQQKEPSNFMRWIHKNFGKFVLPDYPSKPANWFNNKMWEIAQNDLNIPEQYHAPIVAFDLEKNNLSSGDNLVVDAIMSYKMYVNEKNEEDNNSFSIDNISLSCFTHYHEAGHHKYLDPFYTWQRALFFWISDYALTYFGALGLPLFSLYTIATTKNPKISSILNKFPKSTFVAAFLTSYGIAIPASLLLNKHAAIPLIYNNLVKQKQLHERRADLEAAYALKCDQCVQTNADYSKILSPKDQEPNAKNGYLSWKDLEAIAQEHKKNGHMCDFHKKV
jgi:hypothetical protein